MSNGFTLEVLDTGDEIKISPAHFVVAGYTGRDESAVRAHIEELAAIGVPPPAEVPTLYPLDPALLTLADVADGDGLSSGEVEPVLLRCAGRWYLGIGSDITDRDLERDDIAAAKAACAKPLGGCVTSVPNDVLDGGFDRTWDETRVVSYVDGERYQEGRLDALRTPGDLLPRVLPALPESARDGDVVVFAGTIPLLTGTFRKGSSWEAHLTLPHGTTISHTYTSTRRA